MSTRGTHRLPFCIVACLLLFSCATGGDVVKVTEVQKDPYSGLRKNDIAKIEELRKTLTDADKEPGISALLEESPTLTVAEYLRQHPQMRDTAADYRVGGYDVLNISVYEEKDLSREAVRVSADGFISFPFIGRIKVAERTVAEIEQLISRKLADGQYLFDAHVSVMVTKYESRKYSVLGAVTTPGTYPLQAQERVLDGISKAGGVSMAMSGVGGTSTASAIAAEEGLIIRTMNPGRPDQKKVVISIDLTGLLKGGDQVANLLLMDQDVLYIPKADFFYIMGQVKTPGSYAFPKKQITIVEAISMAGGFTRIAASGRTRIVRIENGVEKIYEVNVDAITKGGKIIQAVPVKPNDLIIVPESFF